MNTTKKYNKQETKWLMGVRIHKLVSLPLFVTATILWLVAVWLPEDLYVTDRMAVTGIIFFAIGMVSLVLGAVMREDGFEPYESDHT